MARWTKDEGQSDAVAGSMPQPLGIDPMALMAFETARARQREQLQPASEPHRMRISTNRRLWLSLLPRLRWTRGRRALSAGSRSRRDVSLTSPTVGEDRAHGVADGVALYAQPEVRTAGLPTTPLSEKGGTMLEDREYARSLFRLGGASAVVGALLAGAGNLLHPVTPIDDPEGVARAIAESEIWVPVHLVIVLGLVLMLGGLVAVYHSIRGGTAGALARFGLFAAVAGATIGLVVVLLDGIAAPQLAQEWAAAPPDQRATALSLVQANETIDFALASGLNFVFAAVTFILFGLAVALSDVYPRWLGWVAVLAGLASIGAGLVQALVGEPTTASRVLTIIGPTVITLWLLVIGILLLRNQRAVPIRAAGLDARRAA